MRQRQWMQHDAVEQSEDGGIDANSQREQQYRGDCEAGNPDQLPESEADVLGKIRHPAE